MGKFADIGPTHLWPHYWTVPDELETCSLMGFQSNTKMLISWKVFICDE